MTKLISQHVPCNETHDSLFPVTRLIHNLFPGVSCGSRGEGGRGGRGQICRQIWRQRKRLSTTVWMCRSRAKCSVDPRLTGGLSPFRQTQSISVPHTADLLFSLLSLIGSNSFAPHSPTPSLRPPNPDPHYPTSPVVCGNWGCADFKLFYKIMTELRR
jgi:hypothetical protein